MKEKLVMRTVVSAAWCTVLSIAVVVLSMRSREAPPPELERSSDASADAPSCDAASLPEHVHDGTWAFAKDLWSVLGKKSGNVVFSPYGTARALELAKSGARGKTREEIETLLHGEVSQHAVTGISEANHLWGQVGYPFKKEFRIDEIDFLRMADACRTINDRIAKETKGHIASLLDPDTLPTNTTLVATNALYMKATWLTEFDKSKTKPGAFHEADGQTIEVPFMDADLDDASWGRSGELRVIELPYGAEADARGDSLGAPHGKSVPTGLVMDVIVPENMGSYTFALENALALLAKRGAHLWLPRFETTSEIKLLPSLRALGLKEAIESQADFSGFTGRRDLAIGDVITKTWIKVDEEGTEAASATAVASDSLSLQMPNPPFRVDRPFYFAVRDRRSGTVFFTGRIEVPQGVTR